MDSCPSPTRVGATGLRCKRPFRSSRPNRANSGVVGLDNNGGANQSDIPCQDITLSDNVFVSSLSPFVATSGYSPFGKQQPGAKIPAFFNSFTGQVRQGVCDGAILRSLLSDSAHAIEPFSWGYRNPYAIRFPLPIIH